MSKTQVDGGIKFCIDVRACDMKDWSPERIAAFFDGIAKVIAARDGGCISLLESEPIDPDIAARVRAILKQRGFPQYQ